MRIRHGRICHESGVTSHRFPPTDWRLGISCNSKKVYKQRDQSILYLQNKFRSFPFGQDNAQIIWQGRDLVALDFPGLGYIAAYDGTVTPEPENGEPVVQIPVELGTGRCKLGMNSLVPLADANDAVGVERGEVDPVDLEDAACGLRWINADVGVGVGVGVGHPGDGVGWQRGQVDKVARLFELHGCGPNVN